MKGTGKKTFSRTVPSLSFGLVFSASRRLCGKVLRFLAALFDRAVQSVTVAP